MLFPLDSAPAMRGFPWELWEPLRAFKSCPLPSVRSCPMPAWSRLTGTSLRPRALWASELPHLDHGTHSSALLSALLCTGAKCGCEGTSIVGCSSFLQDLHVLQHRVLSFCSHCGSCCLAGSHSVAWARHALEVANEAHRPPLLGHLLSRDLVCPLPAHHCISPQHFVEFWTHPTWNFRDGRDLGTRGSTAQGPVGTRNLA